MKKKLICIFLAAAVLCCMAIPVYAEHLSGSTSWLVEFTEDGRLTSNYSITGYADEVNGLEPGDDITLQIQLKNTYKENTDWYMSNEVLKSLEEGDAADGAYSYELIYTGPAGTTELYNSNRVGGDDSEGLLEATDALKDFFYLDTMTPGAEALVKLVITLDGETQGNDYHSTLATLKMNFAVEPYTETPTNPENPTNPNTPNTPNKPPVQTGDSNHLLLAYIIIGIAGILFLLLGIGTVRARGKVKEGGRK